jgi:hypothetical protein
LNLFQATPVHLLISFSTFSQEGISCPRCVHSETYSGASAFNLIFISALFVITLFLLYVVFVQRLCSLLLVHSHFLVVYY